MSKFRWAGASDTGQVRNINQDSWFAADGVFVVADGMGGHQGGEVASEIAVSVLQKKLADAAAETDDLITNETSHFLNSIEDANQAIMQEAVKQPDLEGMGTTLCAAVATPEGNLVVANIGDSRVYVFNDGELHQLTVDHSMVQHLISIGEITKEEAKTHPNRNVVTRVLGVDGVFDVDYWEIEPEAGDRFVLCSDGLFNEVANQEIAAVLDEVEDPAEVAQKLVALANAGGGRDNITVLVVDVLDGLPRDRKLDIEPKVHSISSDPIGSGGEGTASYPAINIEDSDGDDQGLDETDPTQSRGLRRLLGWIVGTVVFVSLVLVALGLYARSSYFVGVDNGEVTIFQGRAGGVLFFDPTVRSQTGIEVEDLTPLLLEEVEANPAFASVDGANDYVDGLTERIEPAEPSE